MRTTVTLDADTDRLLRSVVRERGVPFKQALNEAIRAGLAQKRRGGGRRFVQKSFRLGAEQYFRWDKALSVAGALEDEELARRLSLSK